MALRMRDISLELAEDESVLRTKVAEILGLSVTGVVALRVVRRGIDARKKPRILRVYTVEFEVSEEAAVLRRHAGLARLEAVVEVPLPEVGKISSPPRVLVVGMGPAGLFAALRLAQHGVSVSLLERGKPVEQRVRDVDRFWNEGLLDPASNVQFGEGGAGTFSDGKLTTRINSPWMRLVLQTLVDFGAPEEILVQAKPHVGSDRLRRVLINFRQALQSLGVDLRFNTCLTGLVCHGGRVVAGVLKDGSQLACDSLVMAPGHSARDTYRMLEQAGVHLEPKPFAVGVRVEHPIGLINQIQYARPSHPKLPAADYALTWNDPETRRGVYSFCMCPGGEVINAASEPGGLVVNGMSLCRRDGLFSNSALVVSVRPEDFDATDSLAGVRFQRRWEAAAFAAGGGNFRAPAQNLMEFLGRPGGPVVSSCRPQVCQADLEQVLPDFVTLGLRRALPHFDRKMRGFVTADATLIGVETRTSAPLRIVRDPAGQSVSHEGLYPAGEGAGYAGGIMSAALDGLKTAEHIVSKVSNGSHK
jgi:hypothetical protein